jgi:hypothetical protein
MFTESEMMHRTDGFEIIRKIAALQAEADMIPPYALDAEGRGLAPRAEFVRPRRERIMREHNLSDLYVYFWFASRAEEYAAAMANREQEEYEAWAV